MLRVGDIVYITARGPKGVNISTKGNVEIVRKVRRVNPEYNSVYTLSDEFCYLRGDIRPATPKEIREKLDVQKIRK